MDWSSGLAWWAALRLRHQACFDATDRAGMGTAFGLDASLAPAEEGAPAALASPARLAPQPWEHRLIRRAGL